ncbi:TonB-dependent receptor plug domain-containing protein [Pseudoxanthomonas wuyuanensis]
MTRKPSSLAAAIVLALATSPALAQEGAKTLDTLIVTGTRVSDRTVAESTAPIDIITPEALRSTGTTELATALSRAVPSLNFPRPAITDGTDAVRPAQLRGLSPDQVLVLVNGKRYHSTALINLNGSQGRGSSPVDLNTIPVAAIERVEVLRDGASAQYGSDAIAGVINIVLKGSDSGGSIAGTYGQYSAGDGEQWNLAADSGFKLGENGSLHLAAQGGHQDQTDRARPYTGAPGVTPYGRVVQRYGDPEVDAGAVSYNGEFSPAETITFYSFGTVSRREALSNGFFRAAGDARNIPEVYPDGFLPQIFNVSKDVAWVGGFKASTEGGLNIDISYNYGQNHLTFDVRNSLNRSLGTTITPVQTDFYAGALEVTQNVLNLDFNKQLDWGLAYPVTLAFGAEWRGEKFNESPGEPASYVNGGVIAPGASAPVPGAQVFAGFRPSDSGHFNRESYSAYASLEADLTEKFSAGLALRGEDYSDFGSTTSGKLSARYAFTDKVALRGTVSTGFRAPTLQQQYFQSTATNFIGGVPFEIATFRVNNPAAIALGAEPLKAEESENYSLGLVLQPIDDLYITIDAYRIDIDDRIALSENLNSPAVRDFLNDNGFVGVGGGRYFTNAIDTQTEGVDVVGTYNWSLSNSNLALTAGYNYNKTEVTRIADNPDSLVAIDPAAERFGRVELGRFTVGSPRDKFFLGGTWNLGNWAFNANATRYGKFTVLFGNNPDDTSRDQTFDPEWTLDLSASYTLGNWNFTLGGDNVFDSYPDEVIFANSNGGQLPYSSSSPNGFNGAYGYARIGYKW